MTLIIIQQLHSVRGDRPSRTLDATLLERVLLTSRVYAPEPNATSNYHRKTDSQKGTKNWGKNWSNSESSTICDLHLTNATLELIGCGAAGYGERLVRRRRRSIVDLHRSVGGGLLLRCAWYLRVRRSAQHQHHGQPHGPDRVYKMLAGYGAEAYEVLTLWSQSCSKLSPLSRKNGDICI